MEVPQRITGPDMDRSATSTRVMQNSEETVETGPLSPLGPAARWSVTAGLLDKPRPLPSLSCFLDEAPTLAREGILPVAVLALRAELGSPLPNAFKKLDQIAALLEAMTLAAEASCRELFEIMQLTAPYLLIKGPAMARLYPPDWPRTYSDIDLLLTSDYFPIVLRRFLNAGFAISETTIPQREWFNTYCRESVNLHRADGANVDLHHQIPPWIFSQRVSTRELISRSISTSLFGIPVQVPSDCDQLLISALHIISDGWKGRVGLTSWRDVIMLLRRLEIGQAREAFRGASLTWLFDLVTREINQHFPEAEISGPTESHIPNHIQRRLRLLGWYGDTAVSRHRLAWAARLPARNSAAYLVGVTFPSREYLRTRHGSIFHYWNEAIRETIDTRRGADYRMTTVADKSTTVSKVSTDPRNG